MEWVTKEITLSDRCDNCGAGKETEDGRYRWLLMVSKEDEKFPPGHEFHVPQSRMVMCKACKMTKYI